MLMALRDTRCMSSVLDSSSRVVIGQDTFLGQSFLGTSGIARTRVGFNSVLQYF
jgi:hypothetical protein